VDVHIREHLVSLRSRTRANETTSGEGPSENYQSEFLGETERTLVYRDRSPNAT
jgi:hypothetical protein